MKLASIKKSLGEVSDSLFKDFSLPQDEYHIYSHNDADGICSAHLAECSLKLLGKKITINLIPNLTDQIFESLKEPYLLLDLGSNFFNRIPPGSFCIDHHIYEGGGDRYISPWKLGINGSDDLCTSALTYLLLRKINENESQKQFKVALTGIFGDMQYSGIDSTYNSLMIEELKEKGLINYQRTLSLYGSDRYSLFNLIKYALGENLAVAICEDFSITRLQAENMKANMLGEEHLGELAKILKTKIIRKPFFSEDIFSEDPQEHATLINSACRLGEFESAFKFLRGKRESVIPSMENNRLLFVKRSKEYVSLAKKGGIKKIDASGCDLYFFFKDIDLNMCGLVANMLKEEDRPCLVFGQEEENLKFSVRVDCPQCKVGQVLKDVSLEGFRGGGHDRAGGGTLPKEKLQSFIDIISKDFFKGLCSVMEARGSVDPLDWDQYPAQTP